MIIGYQPQFKKPILAGTKIHTMREDLGGRWRRGREMHMVTGHRTNKQKVFKKTVCTAVQIVHLEWQPDLFLNLKVRIGDKYLTQSEAIVFARNDGFETLQEMFNFFKKYFKKKNGIIRKRLIHWTEHRY